MKRFIYVIAWQPQASDPCDRALVFRHTFIEASSLELAYFLGQQWAGREGLFPLPGPGNDYACEVEGAAS